MQQDAVEGRRRVLRARALQGAGEGTAGHDSGWQNVRNIAPDLIVHFGGPYWRSIGTVGHSAIHVQKNDSALDRR